MKIVVKSWGEEDWVVNNELYCFKILRLNEGKSCSYHYHAKKDETFFIIDGKVFFYIDGETIILKEGSTLRLKPGTSHLFKAIDNDAVIFEVSTQHFDSDTHRIDMYAGSCTSEGQTCG